MIDWIKNQVRKGNYQLKVHAIERASLRGIDPLDVKLVVFNRYCLHTKKIIIILRKNQEKLK
jgi:hypothetical protein